MKKTKKVIKYIKLPPADCFKLPYKGYVKPSLIRQELNLQKDTEAYRNLRVRLLKQQGFRCAYCQEDLSGKPANLEHVVPVNAGGTNNPNNLVMSCPECNKFKKNKVIPKQRRYRIRDNIRKSVKNHI